MNASTGYERLALVAENDPRLSHLKHPGFKLNGPAYNYGPALVPILTHTTDVVHVYNFDGELDDQLRLEHLLLVWTGVTTLIIIAGERNGGGETLDETKAIVHKLIKRPDWLERIHVITGTCLRSDSPRCIKRNYDCVRTLKGLVKRRPFVWHNNTTITLLAAVIGLPLASQMKAVTSTCSIMFLSAGLGSAFNKRAAAHEYEKVLSFCKQRNIPFLELQLKLAGWKTDTFAALPGWAETVCKPVSDVKTQQDLQKIMHQGLGFAFWVALSAHQTANDMTLDQIRAHAQTLLRASNVQDSTWSQWPFKSTGMWTGNTVDSAAARFAGMQQNTKMPLSNTIGDVTGAVVDALHLDPDIKDELVILRTHQRYVADGSEVWRFGRGGSPAFLGGHFALVHANEANTLERAWTRIQAARKKSTPASAPYQLLDSDMIQQWKGFCAVMVPLLQGIKTKIHCFRRTPDSSKLILQTLVNLKTGDMALMCSGNDKLALPNSSGRRTSTASSRDRRVVSSISSGRSASPSPKRLAIPSVNSSRRSSAGQSRRSSSASKMSTGSSSSGRSSVGRKHKSTSASSSGGSSRIDTEAGDLAAHLKAL